MKFSSPFLAFLLIWSTPILAAPIRVAGIVVDETNHRPAANAGIELMRAADGKSTPIAKARADAKGRFAFKPQNVGANEILIVRANWNDYTYVAPAYDGGGQLAAMDIKIDPAKVRLAVFETTKGLVPLTFTAHHLALESTPGGLKCIERIVVENATRKTFLGMGDKGASLLLNLPKGAKNVQLDPQVTNAKLEKRPDGYAVIKPIPPSVYDPRVIVIINYEMDWPSGAPWNRKLDFSRRVQYPTKFFFVARTSAEQKLQVTAPKLGAEQTAPLNINGVQETRIVNAIGNPGHGGPMSAGAPAKPALEPGDDLKIAVASPVNPLFWGFLGFVVLLLAAIPAALWKRSTPDAKAAIKSAEPASPAGVYGRTLMAGTLLDNENSRTLIERIAAWDEDFQSGKIREPEYSRQRATWKNELVETLSQQSLQETQHQEMQHPSHN